MALLVSLLLLLLVALVKFNKRFRVLAKWTWEWTYGHFRHKVCQFGMPIDMGCVEIPERTILSHRRKYWISISPPMGSVPVFRRTVGMSMSRDSLVINISTGMVCGQYLLWYKWKWLFARLVHCFVFRIWTFSYVSILALIATATCINETEDSVPLLIVAWNRPSFPSNFLAPSFEWHIFTKWEKT